MRVKKVMDAYADYVVLRWRCLVHKTDCDNRVWLCWSRRSPGNSERRLCFIYKMLLDWCLQDQAACENLQRVIPSTEGRCVLWVKCSFPSVFHSLMPSMQTS